MATCRPPCAMRTCREKPSVRLLLLHRSLSCRSPTDSLAVAAVSLKPDTFEGMRFDFSKPLNQNFALTHR